MGESRGPVEFKMCRRRLTTDDPYVVHMDFAARISCPLPTLARLLWDFVCLGLAPFLLADLVFGPSFRHRVRGSELRLPFPPLAVPSSQLNPRGNPPWQASNLSRTRPSLAGQSSRPR